MAGNGNKRKLPSKKPVITIIVDLAFSTNVRFLDDHELYLDNVELYRVSKTKNGAHLFKMWPVFLFQVLVINWVSEYVIDNLFLNFPTLDFLSFTRKKIGNSKKKRFVVLYSFFIHIPWGLFGQYKHGIMQIVDLRHCRNLSIFFVHCTIKYPFICNFVRFFSR